MPVLIVFVLACMGLWYGGDGLWVNMTSGKLTTFSIETVEEHGIGNNRYINITGGTWGQGYVYEYDQKTNNVKYIIFPLESLVTFEAVTDGEDASIHVLVKKKANTHTMRLDDWAENNGASDVQVEIQGVTMVGFDSIDEESRKLIESMDMKISENVIFIEEGAEPRSLTKNLLMFVPSLLFFIIIIVGFFKGDDDDDIELPESKANNTIKADEPVRVRPVKQVEMDEDAESRSKEAIKQIMIFMMLVDDDVDLEEIETIQRYYKQLTGQEYPISLLKQDMKQVQDGHVTFKDLIKEMNATLTDEGKKMAFEAAFLVAVADGLFHSVEKDMLKTIEIVFIIPDNFVQEMCEQYGIEW